MTAKENGAVYRRAHEVIIEAGEVITGNLVIAAHNVVIAGSVQGTVTISSAYEVEITGEISGDLIINSAYEVDISGKVDGVLKMGSVTELTISGEIKDNVKIRSASEVTISGEIGGDVKISGHKIEISGKIRGSVEGSLARAILSGQVDGDLVLKGAKLKATDTASVGGDVIITKHGGHKISEKAKLKIAEKKKGEIHRRGYEVIIAKGEVIEGDLIIGAYTALIEGRVQGDVKITNAYEVEITGEISGDLDVATAHDVVISGKIGGDAEMQLHELVIEEGGLVVGNISCNGHRIKIKDTVKGSVRGRFATAFLSGHVHGDLELEGARLTATDTASVGGDVIIAKHDKHKISEKAKLNVLK